MIYTERLGALYSSDTWVLITHRLQILAKELEKRSLNAIKAGDVNNATRYAGEANGVTLTFKVIERLGSEISNGQFDADEALSVIENKEGQKEKGVKWLIHKILERSSRK